MIIPALLYIVWDSYFTQWGMWSFNEKYISGIHYFGLPLEEILFFFVVPYCCVFIYECIRCYFPLLKNAGWGDPALKILAIVAGITGIGFWQKSYTQSTFIFLSIAILLFFILRKYFRELNTSLFLVSYAVILLPFLIVNGFLTAIPVVLYNNTENLGARIYSIPFEDVFYGMLLVFLNIVIFEKLRARKTRFKSNPQ